VTQFFLSGTDPECDCTDIAVSNVIQRIGQCSGTQPNNCNGAPLKTCKITGTVTEINCVPGVNGWSIPFAVQAPCTTGFAQSAFRVNCTGGDPGDCLDPFGVVDCHAIFLECGPCH
jgi:hypothetical protein